MHCKPHSQSLLLRTILLAATIALTLIVFLPQSAQTQNFQVVYTFLGGPQGATRVVE
jgi:hypothetical protein